MDKNKYDLIKNKIEAIPAMNDLREVFNGDEEMTNAIEKVQQALYDEIADLVNN